MKDEAVEMETRHLRRLGFAADGEVLRHPEWGGWVHWDALRRQWVAQTRNGVGRTSANVVDVLRRSGFRPVGVPT